MGNSHLGEKDYIIFKAKPGEHLKVRHIKTEDLKVTASLKYQVLNMKALISSTAE